MYSYYIDEFSVQVTFSWLSSCDQCDRDNYLLDNFVPFEGVDFLATSVATSSFFFFGGFCRIFIFTSMRHICLKYQLICMSVKDGCHITFSVENYLFFLQFSCWLLTTTTLRYMSFWGQCKQGCVEKLEWYTGHINNCSLSRSRFSVKT